jgi:hypothetical protein
MPERESERSQNDEVFRSVQVRLVELKENRDRLKTESRAFDPAALDVLLHPQLAEGYRRRIERLERLSRDPNRTRPARSCDR